MKKQILKIFEKDSDLKEFAGENNAFEGLKIISKYTNNLITGAKNDILYLENIDFLIKKGMTRSEFEKLHKLKWTIENSYLACFV
jgi:oligoribonuclease NrnB/cAMP/cGMP phosphodiesterase (DHH superfamily)